MVGSVWDNRNMIRMRIFVLSFMLVVSVFHAFAQKKGVIVSMADGIPIRDVKIFTNTNKVATTNWRGEYTIKSYFTSVTITHSDYVSLTLNLYEMGDTIELLPKFHSLDEVVVYGKHPMSFDAKKATRDARDYYTPNMGGGAGLMFNFDFFSLFTKHGLNSKQKKKHDEIIKTY